MKKKLIGLFVGRFQPLHNGHLAVILHALQEVTILTIIIGSSQDELTPLNCFTATEREKMLRASLKDEGIDVDTRIRFVCIADVNHNERWFSLVRAAVPSIDITYTGNP